MKMICPHCGVNGSADDSLLGRQVKCPKCLELFKVTSEIVKPIPIDEIELQQIYEPPTADQNSNAVAEETDDTYDDIFGEEDLSPAKIAEEELELTGEESEFDEEESELLKLLNQEFVNEPDEESEEEPVAALSGVGQEDGEDLEEWGDTNSALSDFSDDDFAEQGAFDKTESDEDDDNTLTVIEDPPSDAYELGLEEEAESEIVLEDKDILDGTDDDWDIAAEAAKESNQEVKSDDEDIEEWNLAEEVAKESAQTVKTDNEDIEEWNPAAEVAEESVQTVDTDDEDIEEWNLAAEAEVGEDTASAIEGKDEEDVEEWNLTAEVGEDTASAIEGKDEEDIEEWNLTADVAEEFDPAVETDDKDTEEWDLAAEVDNFDDEEREESKSAAEVGQYFVNDDEDDKELVADKEGDSEDELIQKCSACGEYVDATSKHENGANVYCARCVPAGDLEEESNVAAAAVPVAAAASSTGKFTIITLIKDSWRYCKGVKGSIWAALIVMNIILLGIGALSFFVLPSFVNAPGMNPMMIGAGVQVATSFLSYFLTAGIILIAVKKVGGQQYSWKMVFSGFRKIGTLIWAVVLQIILLTIGFILFILPGIYLSVGYILTIPLIMEKGLSPWQAMEASRKAIHNRWWTVLFTFIAMSILSILSAIPAGIGLIWTVPMCFVLVGILYYHFFGDDE